MAIRLYYKVELYPYAVAQVKSVVWEIECKLCFILVPNIFFQISLNLEIVSYPIMTEVSLLLLMNLVRLSAAAHDYFMQSIP